MATVKNAFEETLKSSVDGFFSNFSHQMSDWLREHKEVEISPEEITTALNVTYRPPSTPSTNGSSVQTVLPNVMPAYFSGTGSPASTGTKKKGGRAKKVTDTNLANCEYKMTRGKNQGTACPNKVAGDGTAGADHYCTACLKKAAVKKIVESQAASTTVQPPQMPGSSVSIDTAVEEKSNELQVVELPGRPGWFRETNHGFIISQGSDGTTSAYGVDDGNGGQRDLTETEKKVALSLGVNVVNTNVINLPTVPKVSSFPSIPTIPNVQIPRIG